MLYWEPDEPVALMDYDDLPTVAALAVFTLSLWYGTLLLISTVMFRDPGVNRKIMVILGSGGHTTEMLKMMQKSLENFTPKVYVSSYSDPISLLKARVLESRRIQSHDGEMTFLSTYRAREVRQSWLTALIINIPMALLHGCFLLFAEQPRVILCNGPGVCVPICIVAAVFNWLRIMKVKIIFVESICRVETLSMSGKIMVYIANCVFVQWEGLLEKCKLKYKKDNIHFIGRIT